MRWTKQSLIEADFEALRLSVAQAVRDRDSRIVSLVGLGRRCGVTTVIAALARSITGAGQSVMLVDANAVAPWLHHEFHVPGSPGLVDALEGRARPEQVQYSPDGLPIRVVPLGQTERRGTSHTTEKWRELFGELNKEGLTLIDAGDPENPTTAAIAAASDSTILVIQAGRSTWESVSSTVDRLWERGATVIGIVLNKRRYAVPGFLYRRL